jgi:cytochrome c oxidase cbb3-type subunit 1
MSTHTDSQPNEAAIRAAIDRSVRWPVLFFFASAGFWLLAAILLGLVANLKLISPTLGEACAMLDYPRVQTAHLNTLVYGWAFNAAFGAMIWLMARLCRVEAAGSPAFIVAGKVWNIFVTIGVVAVLLGKGTGIEWLEFPRWCWPVLFLAFALIAAKLFVMFLRRTQEHTFISVWYLVAAIFAFPWLLLTAFVFIFVAPGAAVIATATNHWYISGLLFLFFAPVGLASTYYFLPKVTGRPVHSYGLTLASFWGLIGLGGWTGLQRLIGGPLPTWMPAVSGAAVIVAVIPIALIFLNHKKTLEGSEITPERSPTLRFSYTAIWGFLIFGVLGALLSTLALAKMAMFTQAFTGYAYAAIYGFFSMAMFGAIAFIVPRLTGCEWPSGKSLRSQYWATTYGALTLIITSVVGGLAQGAVVFDPEAPWSLVVGIIKPYATGRSLAFAFLFVANLIFIRNLWAMILRRGRQDGRATLIHEDPTPATTPASSH